MTRVPRPRGARNRKGCWAMKWIGFGITIGGIITGLLTAFLEQHAFFSGTHYGSYEYTVVITALGAAGALLLLFRSRLAPWVLLGTAVAGIVTNFVLWEGAGTFFFAAALIGFQNARRASAKASRWRA